MKSKIHNKYKGVELKGWTGSKEVITQPNQAMSVREILFRNTQGMDYDNYKTPYYEDQATFSSQSLNKIQEMEPVEKLQFLKSVNTQVNELTDKIKSFEDSKAQAIADAQKQVEETQNKTQSAKENASE